MSAVLTVALAAHDAGCSIAPARRDGSKVPAPLPIPIDCAHPACIASRERARQQRRPARGWKHLTHARLDRAEVERLLRTAEGLCVITGAVSRNLVLLETDDPTMADRLRNELGRSGWGDIVHRLDTGYLEITPKGGTHWLLRLTTPPAGNQKLARRPKRPEEMADENDTIQVLVETRGENGQAVTAPSHGRTHPTGRPYVLEAGGFHSIPTLSTAEWNAVVAAARRFDEVEDRKLIGRRDVRGTYEGESIQDWYHSTSSWAELLEPIGWRHVDDSGENHAWRHPGAHAAISATVNDHGRGALYVFSTSTPFEAEQAISRFAAYALLKHDGDMTKAARTLWAWRRHLEKDTA